jgi:hypothetical protein
MGSESSRASVCLHAVGTVSYYTWWHGGPCFPSGEKDSYMGDISREGKNEEVLTVIEFFLGSRFEFMFLFFFVLCCCCCLLSHCFTHEARLCIKAGPSARLITLTVIDRLFQLDFNRKLPYSPVLSWGQF